MANGGWLNRLPIDMHGMIYIHICRLLGYSQDHAITMTTNQNSTQPWMPTSTTDSERALFLLLYFWCLPLMPVSFWGEYTIERHNKSSGFALLACTVVRARRCFSLCCFSPRESLRVANEGFGDVHDHEVGLRWLAQKTCPCGKMAGRRLHWGKTSASNCHWD